MNKFEEEIKEEKNINSKYSSSKTSNHPNPAEVFDYDIKNKNNKSNIKFSNNNQNKFSLSSLNKNNKDNNNKFNKNYNQYNFHDQDKGKNNLVDSKEHHQMNSQCCKKVNSNGCNENSRATNPFSTKNSTTTIESGKEAHCHEQKPETIKYRSIHQTAKLIFNEHGFFKGFYRGLIPRILFNSPSCAISWCSYEVMKHILTQKK